MIKYKTVSLDPNITDKELEYQGCHVASFLSFERAIRETNQLYGIEKPVKGYRVTDQGIEILWK